MRELIRLNNMEGPLLVNVVPVRRTVRNVNLEPEQTKHHERFDAFIPKMC